MAGRRFKTTPTRFHVGDRVLILKGHPHEGKTGQVISLEVLGLIAHLGPRPKVQLDDGCECYLTQELHGLVI